MEVESDEEDEKQEKAEEPPSQLDQDTQVQDMDEGSDDEEEGQKVPPPPETPMPPPLPPTPDQVIVRKDYDPKGRACFLALTCSLDLSVSRRARGSLSQASCWEEDFVVSSALLPQAAT